METLFQLGGVHIMIERLLGLYILYLLGSAVYNLYFHPLSKFPGPKRTAISSIPFAWAGAKGRDLFYMAELHEQYGDVLRITPNELSFNTSIAYKDIYAIKPGKAAYPKDGLYYNRPINGVHSILTQPDDADHARYRRLLAHGFSEKAMREQEPLIKRYVDRLISGLREHSGSAQNMFDLIGELTFNEPFDCLEKAEYHPWIEFVFGSVKAAQFVTQARRFPLFARTLLFLLKGKLNAARETNGKMTRAKLSHRLSSEPDHTDFLSNVLKHEGKETGMSRKELDSTSGILVLGGSETTATLLSAATYYLLKTPEQMTKLVEEVRGSFSTEEEMTFTSVSNLKFLMAVLEETMRIFPPAPLGSPRTVPGEGQTISGNWVPGGTQVRVPHYAAAHSTHNFNDPETFAPERWLADPSGKSAYTNDDRAASQPFSLGPRNCIGKNLAYAEMRLILARVLWNFDLELTEESKNWREGMKIFILWEKPPLFVKLKPVVRSS